MTMQSETPKHEMAIQDASGDTKIMWSKDNEDEVEVARETFNKLIKKGFAAFRVEGKKGDKGEQIRAFDPDAERLIMIPQLAGG